MKKILFITYIVSALLFAPPQSFAVTFNINQLIDYSQTHHPEILKIKNQIEGVEYYLAELKAVYDAKFNLELGRGIMNQEPTYALEPTNADVFKSKLSLKKGFDFGLKVEGFASYEESNYRFNDFYSSLNGKIPTTNLTSVEGLLPPGAGIIKLGVQGTMPVFENWMGVLERLEIERHYNEITQAKMVLNHQLEEKKFKIYQQYYIYELVTSLQKTRLETQKRNKSYYDLVNQKRADGVIPEAERLQVFVSNLASEEELINSQQLKEETLLDLKNMIGYQDIEPLAIEFEENSEVTVNNPLDDFEIFKTKAMAYSFMEKAASLNIQNAMKKVEMVNNMLNPKTDLFFGVSTVIQKTDPALLISEGNPLTYPNYFVGLQTEIFGNSNTEVAKVEQAKTDEKSAAYDYENFKLILDQFLHKAYLATHYYQEAFVKSNERIIYHRKLMEELKSEFARGRINMQLLTQAENLYQLSELGHLQNRVKLKTAQTAIKYLAGEL